MPQFLIRSLTDATDVVTLDRPDGTLPRNGGESYVPWAVTFDNRVVYAKTGEHTGWRGGGDKHGPALRPYDTMVSQNRRRLAESELGLYALNHLAFIKEGVLQVTQGIQRYHDALFVTRRTELLSAIYSNIGSYFYTNGRSGFGRISQADHRAMTPEQVRKGIMQALATGSLDQKMSIHDAFGRKILPILQGDPFKTYTFWGPILRQDWFENPLIRGRVNNPTPVVATTTGGIVGGAQGGQVGTTGQARDRGVDMFNRDHKRNFHSEANEYYDDLDARNLLFGAGISGTTGTLLQSAFSFGGHLSGELLKQYVFAIIGYLVGGGMHSYHESLAVARKTGLAYTPGVYLPSLPMSFTMSGQCREWSAKYYDIVHLGATHWRHNTPSLPSHLNSKLRPANATTR